MLTADTSYDVRVQARNGDGETPIVRGRWWGPARPPRGITALPDSPSPDPKTAQQTSVRLCLRTNRPARTSGSRLTVSDSNSLASTRSYQLEGPDADSFDFDTSSHRIRTKRGVTYDLESKSSYGVDGDGLRRSRRQRRDRGEDHAGGRGRASGSADASDGSNDREIEH